MKLNILIIEDEKKAADLLQSELCAEGHQVTIAQDGEKGLELALERQWDVIICDIMLPKLSGLKLIPKVREAGITTPILVLSAKGELEERVEGLEAGADDYLPKPYAMSELFARLRSISRRGAKEAAFIELDTLKHNPSTRETWRAGQRIELSSREARMLTLMLQANGKVVSRKDILHYVWQYDFDPGTNIVEVYIRRLREKVDRTHPVQLIHTVRGLGYLMKDSV